MMLKQGKLFRTRDGRKAFCYGTEGFGGPGWVFGDEMGVLWTTIGHRAFPEGFAERGKFTDHANDIVGEWDETRNDTEPLIRAVAHILGSEEWEDSHAIGEVADVLSIARHRAEALVRQACIEFPGLRVEWFAKQEAQC